MIIWLASYPRSGNTLLRMILKSVFGIETYSKYNDPFDIGSDEKIMEMIGHRRLDSPWSEAYQKMKETEKVYFVKTHDYPEDDSMAVYIVRDGRASIISYQHYLKDFIGIESSFDDIIAGFVLFGSWGSHLDAWNPLERPNTLLIKYESLLSDSEKEIKRLSDFLCLTPSGTWKNNFEQFHKINPKFFREGVVKKDYQIKDKDLELFLLFHGDWMKALEYNKIEKVSKQISYHLRELTNKVYKKFENSQAEYNKINSLKHKFVEEMKALIVENTKLVAEKDNLAQMIEGLTIERDKLISEKKRFEDEMETKVRRLSEENDTLVAEKHNLAQMIEGLTVERDKLISEKKRFEDEMETKVRRLSEERDTLVAEKHNLAQMIEGLTVERDKLISEKKRLQEQTVSVEEKIRKLQERSHRVEVKISELREQIKEQEEIYRKKRSELITERRRLETELNQRNEQIAALLHSWSWKITKPLRIFGDLLRGKFLII